MNWYKKANLWDEIEKFGPGSLHNLDSKDPDYKRRIQYLSKTLNIPEEKLQKDLQDRLMSGGYAREFFTSEYGWSVPSQEAINKIKEFVGSDDVVEIGSGYGMWAKLMKDSGITVYATDVIADSKFKHYNPNEKTYTDIEDLDAIKAIQKYSSVNVLLMSWPPYDEPIAANAIKNFKGNKLIFIGEGEGGCTADSEFFEILSKYWHVVGEIGIPQWSGIHDDLTLYKRK